MKFLLLLLLPLILIVKEGAAQTVTISKKNAALSSVFTEISRQTNYGFVYNNYTDEVKAAYVTIDMKNATLKEVLDSCFRSQRLTYTIQDRNVIVLMKEIARQPSATPTHDAVTGTVTDINNKPLPGANIRVKGVSNGAVADGNGSFELKGVKPNTIVQVSYIGYESQELKLSNEKSIRIMLTAETKSLNEVVTNGYRTTTRRDNLGTSTKITAAQIAQQPVNNPLAAMQARVPGMIVTQRGGLPGTPFVVQIRGRKSIGPVPGVAPANSPLFIIDGVPFLSSSEGLTQRSRIIAHSPFSTLNPEDIESIEVLKDAGETSIYGSLGANGVILITTKKAQPGKTSASANFYSGFGMVTRYPDYMNTEQYIAMRKEALRQDNETANPANAGDLLSWDNSRYTNWQKYLIGGTANLSNAHIRLTSGSANTQFAFSIGYNKETTVFPSDHGKTLVSSNLNINHVSSDKKFEFSLATSYGSDKSNLMSTDPSILVNTPPNAPHPYDSSGNLVFRENNLPFQNPVAFLKQPYTVLMERLTSGLRLSYKITSSFTIRTDAGYTVITADETLKIPNSSIDPLINPGGQASFGNSKNRNWIIEPRLEFARCFRDNDKLKMLIGSSFREQTLKGTLMNGVGYTSDANLNSITGATTITAKNGYEQYRVISAYGLINYNRDGKYLAEATIRQDGSSRFGPRKRFGNFASIAAGWIFSNEKIIRQDFSSLSFGKIKISYGTTGNDQMNNYLFLDTWSNTQYPYQGPAFRPSRLANNETNWELQKSIDIGLDLGFFKNRILLSAVWNHSRTSNQLIMFTLPTQTGFSSVTKNFPAVVQNRNLEFELNTVNIRNRHIKWTTSFNLSIQRNKLASFPGLESSPYRNEFIVGQPLNLIWGYRTAGIDPVSGIYRILDRTGKVIPIPATLPSSNEIVNLGTDDPAFFGGLQNSIEYGNWQLHFLFQFVKQKGKDGIYSTEIPPGFPVNVPVNALKRWVTQNDAASYQRYTQSPGSPAYYAAFFAATSDLAFTDASYIRLKNISLSYTFPDIRLSKLKLTSFRVYFQGQNILTFTKFIGFDPETYTNLQGLPPLKLFTAGIQVSFQKN